MLSKYIPSDQRLYNWRLHASKHLCRLILIEQESPDMYGYQRAPLNNRLCGPSKAEGVGYERFGCIISSKVAQPAGKPCHSHAYQALPCSWLLTFYVYVTKPDEEWYTLPTSTRDFEPLNWKIEMDPFSLHCFRIPFYLFITKGAWSKRQTEWQAQTSQVQLTGPL